MCVKEQIQKALFSAINTLGIVLIIWAIIVVVLAVYFRSVLVGVLGALVIFSLLFIFIKVIDVMNKILDILKE